MSLDERGARATLHRCLVTDLAHGAEILPAEQALALVERFFAFFDANTWYGTNGRFIDPRHSAEMLIRHSATTFSRAWAEIADATFDMRIVAVGSRHVGVVWVVDEN